MPNMEIFPAALSIPGFGNRRVEQLWDWAQFLKKLPSSTPVHCKTLLSKVSPRFAPRDRASSVLIKIEKSKVLPGLTVWLAGEIERLVLGLEDVMKVKPALEAIPPAAATLT
jgi:hypothetical protein